MVTKDLMFIDQTYIIFNVFFLKKNYFVKLIEIQVIQQQNIQNS